MTVVGERRDGDVRDVVHVDEGLDRVSGRQCELSGEYGLQEEALVEVLVEPAGPDDGHVGAAVAHLVLGDPGALLAPPGEQHQPARALATARSANAPTASAAPGKARSG